MNFIFQFDMQGYTGGDETADLSFKFWLSHNSALDTEDDYELTYTPNHNELATDRTDDTEHAITLNHDSPNGSPLVSIVKVLFLKHYYCFLFLFNFKGNFGQV